MAGTYENWLTTDKGLRLSDIEGHTLLDNALWFTCSRIVNAIGFFEMGLPHSFDDSLLKPDRMVQIWRAPMSGALSLWRPYFLRKWRYATVGGKRTLVISGPDINDLLRRRIVAAYAGSSQADKTDKADDMMKEIVTEAMADGVAPTPDAGTRAWADLSVQGDLGAGPTLTKAFAWKKLLTRSGRGVLPDIAAAAREAGTEVFFDIVPATVSGTAITFQFRTYTGQPGQDVSDSVVFDEERGNLGNPSYELDYTEEENYVLAGGQGLEEDLNVQQVYDSDRYSISQWARCEGFAYATDQDADNGVRESGRAVLEAGRPRRRFTGEPLDTKGTRFGRDWDFGYKAAARYAGQDFDAIARAVVIKMTGKSKETIKARLDYEG